MMIIIIIIIIIIIATLFDVIVRTPRKSKTALHNQQTKQDSN